MFGRRNERPRSGLISIRLSGSVYIGQSVEVPPDRVRETLSRAVQPACNDTGGSDAKDLPVAVYRLDGVDPAVAVFGDQGVLSVRDGSDASLLPGWAGRQ